MILKHDFHLTLELVLTDSVKGLGVVIDSKLNGHTVKTVSSCMSALAE